MSDIVPPAIDTAKIIEEVTAKVSEAMGDVVGEKVKASVEEILPTSVQSVRDDVVKSITDTLTGKQDDPDQSPWVREKRNPHSYDEVTQWAEQRAVKRFEAIQAEKETKIKSENEAIEKSKLEDQQTLVQQWDTQLKDLTTKEFIPAPAEEIQAKLTKNEKLSDDDLKDPGIEARRELYKLGNEHGEKNLELVYYKYYLPNLKNDEPGKTAPVVGKTKTVAGGEGDMDSYEVLHGMTIQDVASKTG